MSNREVISSSAEEQIEFNKIKELLAGYARGTNGRLHLLNLQPSTDIHHIAGLLDEVYEYTEMANLGTRFQLNEYLDISDELEHLVIEGYVPEQDKIHEVGRQLEMFQTVQSFFAKAERQREFKTLAHWKLHVPDMSGMIKSIRAVIDQKGDVRPDASAELLAISHSLEAASSRLNREFVRLISSYKAQGWLTDTVESIRSGRRVVCVQAEHKRKIKGIVHDESTTGRTVFIEPDLIVEINNNIIELEGEFKKEVFRLLKEVCQRLRPSIDDLHKNFMAIVHWDIVQSMSLLGRAYEGNRPKVQEEATLHLIGARHPLLILRNKAKSKEVIPFDLVLNPPNRLLILSGPNAGGKSILMKATGLIQVMAQCGMLIPADGSSVISVMKHIAVDIGDQQSIEEDLSTYSSRLKNMKETLFNADESTLILVDEFGSGTDPKIGGAIAEAILDALVKKKSFGVLTTHYPNIKMYAHRTAGVVNGAMMFDKEKIAPTYRLKIGKPGSSFAFEIAERTGLPKDVIAYARKSAGTQTVELEDLIHDLDDKTKRLEQDTKKLQDKQKELDRLIANYEQLRLDLEVKRRRFKMDQKKASLHEVSQYSQEMSRLMKDLKKEKDVEKAKEQMETIKEKQKKYASEIRELSDELMNVTGTQKEIKAGDHVKLRATDQIGLVERINRDKAVVVMGQMQMTIPLAELLPANVPLEIRHERSVKADIVDYSKFENELDIRGMPPEEASHYLERFIDAAFMSSRPLIRIVHGKGTGVLRQLVARTMKSYPFKSVHHPPRNEGGDGVTIGTL